ncbi:MAG: hypothetical protein E4G90_10840 [Gemmatimonadales bacterium]|nr:MAG: hypothetical protein E4G90_10840 [Gemmatimonadales bacterium]
MLAIEKIGGQLRIYTSRGKLKTIYEVVLVGGDEVFRFNQVYSGPDGIEYPNSMINTGDTHVWLGPSGIMSIGEYDRTPVRQEWLHKSSGVIYKGIEGRWVSGIEAKLPAFGPINQAACEQAVGGYDPNRKVMWFSWPTDSNVCPNMTMTINPMYGHTSLVDHGFTSFLSHKPDYKLMVREMMAVYGGCDIDLEMKEGEPYEGLVADSPPAYLRNETEDINLPVHEDSLCARLQDVAIEELCASCEAENKFLMASAEDFTIKEFTPTDYVREAYVDEGFSYPCPQTTPGSYTDSGYVTLFQRDPSDLGSKVEKLLTKVLVDFTASPQTTPNSLFMEAGSASQPGCMRWEQSDPVDLSCLTDATDAEHETDNTRADEPAVFQFYSAGIFLAWRMYLEGTGGGSDFSSATMSTRLKTGEWR